MVVLEGGCFIMSQVPQYYTGICLSRSDFTRDCVPNPLAPLTPPRLDYPPPHPPTMLTGSAY